MVNVGTGTIGTKVVDSDYPYEDGLVAGTTRHLEDPETEEDREGIGW